MEGHRIVSRDQWIEERKALLAREKEFTRLRDQLSRHRRELPWVRVDKDYVFEGANGKQTLSELFAGRQQLVVYHLMFDPSWEEACSRCSFWADNFNGVLSFGNDFNYDYYVSFTPEELEQGEIIYNYAPIKTSMTERPGISVFYKDQAGRIFHTYSCYSRGLDMLNVAYHYLDLTPKGRDEEGLPFPMAWVAYHDAYGA